MQHVARLTNAHALRTLPRTHSASSACRPACLQGVTNFALFASNAWGVTLCLFSEADLRAGRVTLEVPLAPEANRTGDVWHIALPGLDPSLLYGYRVYGSNDEQHEDSEGQRHDPVRGMHAVVHAVVWWRAVQRLSMRGQHVCCVPCRAAAKGIVCAHASRCGMRLPAHVHVCRHVWCWTPTRKSLSTGGSAGARWDL